MRRKSVRTANKKTKASPEKKVEKVKRTRSRRHKQSSSSENESAEEVIASPVKEVVVETLETPVLPVKDESSPEEHLDQVWQVKASVSPKDTGEIQKLKICLTRPPSTPERADRSPRSKRKHSRATSSSDTPNSEGVEEKKKTKHRSRKSVRDSKDENQDSQNDDFESEHTDNVSSQESLSESNKELMEVDNTPVSTTNDNEDKNIQEEGSPSKLCLEDKTDADTTVVSPIIPCQDTVAKEDNEETTRKRSTSIDKSEVLDIHANIETTDVSLLESTKEQKEEKEESEAKESTLPLQEKVSDDNQGNNESEENNSFVKENLISPKTDVVESVEQSNEDKVTEEKVTGEAEKILDENVNNDDKTVETPPSPKENIPLAPFLVNRKRRWGPRPSKISTQKSITISTDILNEIIPDVKPTEFEEVIEEKKHKKIILEKVERPILPKIVIDNSENAEQYKRDSDDKENVKKESQLAVNRKISIVKESDSIIARPPSPPRNEQSSILYIKNLVRPFTLPQLKNLLQRTGRIAEDGFWIDKIKSRCYVQYENEDQAVETRHALHGVKWPVSNPKTLHVDFSNQESLDKAKSSEDADVPPPSAIPGTVEDWLREQDLKRERGDVEKPWERKTVREWDVGKGANKDNKDGVKKEERPLDKRRHRSIERSPEPARKFKKKEEEAPAKLLDDLFRKTKTTPCIYWLPLSAETIAVKEEQRRKHMAEHERRMQELRRRRH